MDSGSAWLDRLVWDQKIAGLNPVYPIYINIERKIVVEVLFRLIFVFNLL